MRIKSFLKIAVIAVAIMFIIITFSPLTSTNAVNTQNVQAVTLTSDSGTRTPIKHVINI